MAMHAIDPAEFDPAPIAAFVARCQAALPDEPIDGNWRVKIFTRNRPMAAMLLKLVLEGEKYGTVSLPWEFETRPDDYPRVGMYWVAVDGDGVPGALCRLNYVEAIPFDQVDETHSACESAPIRAIDKWRQTHWNYWKAMTKGTPAEDRMSQDMPVICQRFDLLYPMPAETGTG